MIVSSIVLRWLRVGLIVAAPQMATAQATNAARPPIVNDVSRLNPVEVRQVYEVHDVEEIRSALTRARRDHLKVSIAGRRHSQGPADRVPGRPGSRHDPFRPGAPLGPEHTNNDGRERSHMERNSRLR